MHGRLWNLTFVVFIFIVLEGCASYAPLGATGCSSLLECTEEPKPLRPTQENLLNLPIPKQKAVVAVYNFDDLTGQRKSSQQMALFSTAVTQGADQYLIDALRSAGSGNWFVVVERAGLDALTRERQLIRQTRQTYDGEVGNTLKPLLFAGLLFEGGIIQYDTNIETGGNGARYLGIGSSNQWRKDEITVSLRVVLVQTGEVLLNTMVSKTILSAGTSRDLFRFVEMGTELVELETGLSQNEAVGYATRAAIEESVYQIIKKGLDQEIWDFNYSELKEEER
jgi:curli production assembly/transport component CsgG|tara:strand:+ start:2632 stop:3474 length:843 start_codon:yes stop_codon:yes gene_type:complete